MNDAYKSVSVIIPCYNEEKFLAALLDNLSEQDYPADRMEIIFADGRSQDRTREIISGFAAKDARIQLVDNPHRYVPHALNAAIKASKGDVIVRMDAHSIYPKNYISILVKKLFELNAENVGGVWDTKPANESDEALAIVIASSHPVGIGNAAYRLGSGSERKVDTVPFGCFRRDLFDRIGYFDEDLLRNQDDEFNARIIQHGGSIWLIPDVKIEYFARESRRKLAKMFYQYGLFKPLVNLKLGSPATLRQFAPPLLVFALTMPLFLGIVFRPVFLLWLSGLSMYLFLLSLAAIQACGNAGFRLFPHVVQTFGVIHLSYGIGYLYGIWKFILRKEHLNKNAKSLSSSR